MIAFIAFNNDLAACLMNNEINFLSEEQLTKLLNDPSILKLVNKHNIEGINCQHIYDFLIMKGCIELLLKLKNKIIYSDLKNRQDKLINTVQLMHKYKRKCNRRNRSTFNKKRDAYLLFLTIFNEILVINGSMQYDELISLAREYPNFSRMEMDPTKALDSLIYMKALIFDDRTSIVSL